MQIAAMDVGFRLLAVLALVLANGFFVAAEFSLITVRKTRIDQLLGGAGFASRWTGMSVTMPDPEAERNTRPCMDQRRSRRADSRSSA